MISGDKSLAEGKHGAFYNTLEEFHKYWDRIDIICPRTMNNELRTMNNNPPTMNHEPRTMNNEPRTMNHEPPTMNLFENVFIHSSPWPILFQPWWILKKGQELHRQNRFDIITVHEYPPFYNGIGARMLWNRIKAPYVLEIHHIPGHPRAADFKEKLYKWLMKTFIKFDSSKAKAVRVVNQHQVPEFLIGAGVPKNKIVYIPSFYIDLGTFKPLNLPKEYDIVFVGRLVKNKGVELLLEAIKFIVHRSSFMVKCLIVGDGPLRKVYEQRTMNHELKDNISFYGWAKDQQEIAKLLNQSKVLVIPSYNEGGPRVAIEAMACGLPVITTKVGLMVDIIKEGENGLFTDWTAKEIAEKIIRLLKDAELQNKFSKAGLELVKQFERKEAIKNYAEKLHSLIRINE